MRIRTVEDHLPFAHWLAPTEPRAGDAVPAPYVALARHGEVRSLLPAGDRRRLRRSLGRPNGPESRSRHGARRLYALLAASPLADVRHRLVQVDDSSLRAALAPTVGRGPRDIALALHFGPPRANRKPVVQVLDRDGTLLAVAKVATNPLTVRLVTQETSALQQLARARPGPVLTVPRLLAATTWEGAQLLVQSALVLPARPRVPTAAVRRAAEQELVRSTEGPSTGAAPWVRDLLAKLPPESAGVPDPGARWLDDVAVGASHGDWSPQNLSVVQGGVAAWDWERFAEDRPLGFDAAHLVLMQQLGRTPSGGNLLRLAREELGPWQPSLDDARLDELARLVLLDLLARYVGDGLARSGGPGRDVVARIRAATAARDTTDPRRTR